MAEEPDAGSFLITLEENDAVTYAAFLKDPSTRVRWGEDCSRLSEPVAVRVEGLIHLLLRRIARGRQECPMHLTANEMRLWTERSLKSVAAKC